MSKPPAVKLIPFFGMLALSVALGALLLGYGLLLPSLEMNHQLIDANLAKSLSYPLSLHLADALIAAQLILALLLPRWITHRLATTLGIILFALAVFLRLWVIPELYITWSRVDLVSKRPVDQLQAAYQWTLYQYVVLASMFVLNIILLWLTSRPRSIQLKGNSTTDALVST